MKIKTIFLGTSDFAIPVLEKLNSLEYIDLQAVITQPDRPVGRKQVLTPPIVKKWILENNLDVDIIQPEKIRMVAEEILNQYKPELIIVASYGQILPKSIIEYPKYKCLNLHGSLLPELRGAVPIQMAILNGLKRTGVTLQVMSEGMDEGDIVSTIEVDIEDADTTETLMEKAGNNAAKLLEDSLKDWIDGEIVAKKQDDSKATYCYMKDIAKENAEITFETPVEIAERMIRAFYPWPVAWGVIDEGKYAGRKVKVFRAKKADSGLHIADSNKEELALRQAQSDNNIDIMLRFSKHDDKLVLELNDGMLELLEIQLEGKEKRDAEGYLYLANNL